MAVELRKMKLEVVQQAEIKVYYAGVVVGEYYADLLVADAVIVEVKAVRALLAEHEAQLLNYLKATPYEVGLLLNFGPKPEIKRKVYDNERKGGTELETRGIRYGPTHKHEGKSSVFIRVGPCPISLVSLRRGFARWLRQNDAVENGC